ncbi:ATP-dependent helicase [Rickettsiales endosymbiont of Peranema trichophorum]|uniref:ATP-dependent helicase n=1 Tax=Rickettsiales endosymbiont of Peranema trichophorum TaxID=2486577 RepID=UPI001A93941C|nr:UvrD-helicase domain-containing protein [Rickettsiales endosymbiont of Peranema trichophorum]
MKPQNEHFEYLTQLNKEQAEAVIAIDGPQLVLAGAGTGKTKVLTTRIAHILNMKRALPTEILAVTFTNKAAKEMKERVGNLMNDSVDHMWLGTFHAIAAKILRIHSNVLEIDQNFTIVDSTERLKIAKQIFEDYNIDTERFSYKLFLYQLERLKDRGLTPDKVQFADNNAFGHVKLRELYVEYQKRLVHNNAADFGDLLLYNIELFNGHLNILEHYHSKFKYILVDEYQDTNVAQYIWLRLLAQGSNNICCVGDDDQSIYGWRGAEIGNILKFEKDFQNAKVTRLEKNYRSTSYILGVATKLISHNVQRHGKNLWTDRPGGEKVKLISLYNEVEEARYVADQISQLRRVHNLPYSSIAILVRVGYQTRSFEESLNSFRIPYKIIGGMKFYERAEIKDGLAYIRLLYNRADNLAFERIVNTPKRGIGRATVDAMVLESRAASLPLFEVAKTYAANTMKGRSKSALLDLLENFEKWSSMLKYTHHADVVNTMLEESNYLKSLREEDTAEAKERIDNLKELINGLNDFSNIGEFLEHVSLLSDIDTSSNNNVVSIMTIHAAKGLEFDTVFLPGWEEGLFPSTRSVEEKKDIGLEEERRLAYVAITRAKQRLSILFTSSRRIYGHYQYNKPSRFIKELPKSHVQLIHF